MPVTSLCASVSYSLKRSSDRTSVGGLLWDYRSPCMKVLSGVVVMLAKEIPEQATDPHILLSDLCRSVI